MTTGNETPSANADMSPGITTPGIATPGISSPGVNSNGVSSTPGVTPAGVSSPPPGFKERRNPQKQRKNTGYERRQFTNSLSEYSEEATELGQAIDQYKLMHRRRFINFEELLSVVKSLGYSKTDG